ncbi:RNA-directed DNA polymerase (reverse transcriptase)-related family protein [Rhynchospora pubera]|uniref:RNA-directed DNA polymerase (Reverse transcriptase)-related family protein n=1 Tax=Rhynchospora pubera TaxID=906938 RepID=A0AAV8GMZ3_9POAL|nr:RNA-directed DNA polymerase (reverse transcriptase)-related family protein [Rhynchospora pubera]KAJ4807019.1 RNA-directed DNA polymerase (reverse transcriptase)-related family protein [Rhynchospora pubera]KAJ4810104.1 RNA-directed DNA polymerase (reverse transcriptase)-related family protein [Rhynchospora pubera]KAJ4814350.1 RNA-directed DNA polymerase (reverse transcriptase)-related family protein [Rhynchospora pubera]
MSERSTSATEFSQMQLFNDVIRDLHLFDTPLSNKRFTWSNKQPTPIQSRLDRVLLSPHWLTSFPVIDLQALSSPVSDHIPIRLHCKQMATGPKIRRMELFWFKHEAFHSITQDTWAEHNQLPSAQNFFSKNQLLQERLNNWHKSTFPSVNVHLENAKHFIALFNSVEETRALSSLEMRVRVLAKERAYHLACILESRWHQRARIQWLKNGDRNTRYFHATASAKLRKKHISSLIVDGETLVNPSHILQAFTDFYKNLLGKSDPVFPCSLHLLYGHQPTILQLGDQFTSQEVHHAVMKLANNKASGPDGLPNEFVREKWSVVGQDIMRIFDDLFSLSLNLKDFNRAHIILLPKSQNATSLSSFRPISVINYIPKLIAKVLANRLGKHIDEMISPSQTGFIKGRLIHENFLVARELIAHFKTCKEPVIMIKLDFYKAFDTVNWSFLLNVLKVFGAPSKFIDWVELLLTTSSSAVLVNNQIGAVFQHQQGLRQGDPLSPFLFIMVADVLSKMCQATALSIPFCLSDRIRYPFQVLQYADDTLIFCTVKGRAVHSLRFMLTVFSLCSGLNLNLSKSSFVPFNLSPSQTYAVSSLLDCEVAQLPLTYLGLPLTSSRPSKDVYRQLIEKLEQKLAGWKNKLLSRAGRLTLVSSVLTSIPIFLMSAFKLPSWVVKAIDKLRRNFLWGRSTGSTSGIPLLAWDRVCLPKHLGGMGVLNLRILNLSLLLKWLWRLFEVPNSQWATVTRSLFVSRGLTSPLSWTARGSFFWKDLLTLRHIFSIFTHFNLGSGKEALFWYSNWGNGLLRFFECKPPPSKAHLTVSKVCHNLFSSLQAPWNRDVHNAVRYLSSFTQSDARDKCVWKCTSSGKFTVKSAYNALVSTGKVEFQATLIWSTKLPPSIRVFIFLLFHDRVLTQEALVKRNFVLQPGCSLCDSTGLETATHIFCLCPYSQELWSKAKSIFPSLLSRDHTDVKQLIMDVVSGTTHKATVSLTVLWALWLERNNRVFRGAVRNTETLLHWVTSQQKLFLKHC